MSESIDLLIRRRNLESSQLGRIQLGNRRPWTSWIRETEQRPIALGWRSRCERGMDGCCRRGRWLPEMSIPFRQINKELLVHLIVRPNLDSTSQGSTSDIVAVILRRVNEQDWMVQYRRVLELTTYRRTQKTLESTTLSIKNSTISEVAVASSYPSPPEEPRTKTFRAWSVWPPTLPLDSGVKLLVDEAPSSFHTYRLHHSQSSILPLLQSADSIALFQAFRLRELSLTGELRW